ncbi:alpha/beta fold hydrolase [Methanofollis aquaemaris]|uniref:Alpha/beta fold hydrolase n=1 Tax=Methanofollis aquaemaris TaxID=126734 RepID=A0A8A3S3N6_9EURY|nr:alpha/beta fold hydrolase [Methanofollis aquaemaris]QSZ66351.1 alpha/beta fold hydrolase [Methanofollis aquaemaris]
MQRGSCPAVLVHGWRSHPGVWKRLIPHLEAAAIPYRIYDHSEMGDAVPGEIAAAFGDFLALTRDETGYAGPVDMVCHSMGTGIARYLLEVIDGGRREERVRQLIGLGPPNNGSSMAELFSDPGYGPEVVDRLAGVFVPRTFDPEGDVIVQEFRPGSRTIAALRRAKGRDDIAYRLILAANLTATPAFFPCFEGKTWTFGPDGEWRTTYAGDGIVPLTDSYLPGAGVDILPADPASLAQRPEQYCHIGLPRNPEVMARVMEYLQNPATRPQGVCPERE